MVDCKKSGYTSEVHTIQTADAYILTLTRISATPTQPIPDYRLPTEPISVDDDGLQIARRIKPAVLIVHGMSGSGEQWLINSPEKALPYKLLNEGYDCWLANLRGTPLSRGKASTGPEGYRPKKYWDFSWHEMAIFDIPSMIDFILATTGNKSLYFVGHSLGATIFLVGMALRPEYCSKVKVMASLAPAVHTKHIRNIYFNMLVPLVNLMSKSQFLRTRQIMEKPVTGWFRWLGWVLPWTSSCSRSVRLLKAIGVRIGLFGRQSIEEAQMAIIAERWPAPSSMKVICHSLQCVSSGIFRQYDYGRSENVKLYGQVTPPAYDFGNVKVPIATFYSEYDELCTTKDVTDLTNQLPNSIGLHRISHSQFAHFDFVFGKDADMLVYDRVIDVFRK